MLRERSEKWAREYMGHHDHKQQAPQAVRCLVLTISDTRVEQTDTSGQYIVAALEKHGHQVLRKVIVPDEPTQIEALVRAGVADPAVQAIICNGGTGISFRDRSYEAVTRILEKRLDGFGELFRLLSYQQIGSAAMMSRAVAGIAGETVIFLTPGAKDAVELALGQLILPELGHAIWELRKHLD